MISTTEETGHIFIIDLKSNKNTSEWLLSAVLWHQQPFKEKKTLYSTSMATLQIKSSLLHNLVVSIQQALIEGRKISAEISFNRLRMLKNVQHAGMPKTIAEVLAFNHLIVEYRNG